jgi:hypothetical protein
VTRNPGISRSDQRGSGRRGAGVRLRRSGPSGPRADQGGTGGAVSGREPACRATQMTLRSLGPLQRGSLVSPSLSGQQPSRAGTLTITLDPDPLCKINLKPTARGPLGPDPSPRKLTRIEKGYNGKKKHRLGRGAAEEGNGSSRRAASTGEVTRPTRPAAGEFKEGTLVIRSRLNRSWLGASR